MIYTNELFVNERSPFHIKSVEVLSIIIVVLVCLCCVCIREVEVKDNIAAIIDNSGLVSA